MRIRVLNRQNDWSDFGKGFFVKICKNTGFLPFICAYHIRKNAQRFLKAHICNIISISKIQNKVKADMNANKERLGNARSIR